MTTPMTTSMPPAASPDLMAAFAQMLDGFLALDRSGRVTHLNTSAARLLGSPALVGKILWDELPALSGSAFGQVLRTALAVRQPTSLEASFPGTERWYDCRVSPNAAGLSVFLRDVTDVRETRRRLEAAEEALEESERWMRRVAEASPSALLISRWDDGALLYTNRRFRDMVCLGSEEEARTHFAGEFYARPAEGAALRNALSEPEAAVRWDGQFRRLDGLPFRVAGSVGRFMYKGEAVLFSSGEDAGTETETDPLTGLLNHRAFYKRLTARPVAPGKSAVVRFDLDDFQFFNDTYGHAAGDDVLRRTAEMLCAAFGPDTILARFGGDEFALLLPDAGTEDADALSARLSASLPGIVCEPPGYGTAIPVSLSLGAALFPGDAPAGRDAARLAGERLRSAKTGASTGWEQALRESLREEPGFPMLEALVTAVDAKDSYTHRHSKEVLVCSQHIAQALGLDPKTQRTVQAAALLHDVGKIGVPDAILRKPGRLSAVEFDAVKLHPEIGAAIVAAAPGLAGIVPAVQHHHERWDGGGYPGRLRGEGIPLLARLLAVADAYSAMTADRPYRKGMDREKACGILEAGAGTQWDPDCVRALLGALIPPFGALTRLALP